MKAVRTARRKPRKIRKTFSLSPSVVQTLEAFRAETNQDSVTAALEELVRSWQIQREKERIAAETTAYYDSLTDEEVKEEAEWGKMGEYGLAALLDEE